MRSRVSRQVVTRHRAVRQALLCQDDQVAPSASRVRMQRLTDKARFRSVPLVFGAFGVLDFSRVSTRARGASTSKLSCCV